MYTNKYTKLRRAVIPLLAERKSRRSLNEILLILIIIIMIVVLILMIILIIIITIMMIITNMIRLVVMILINTYVVNKTTNYNNVDNSLSYNEAHRTCLDKL